MPAGTSLLLALCVEVDPADRALYLVEADVIEALKTSSTDRPYSVVGHQKVFLPSHKYVLPLGELRDVENASLGGFLERPKSTELSPVLQVDFISGAPVLMLSQECVLRTDDFAFEVGSKGRMVFGQAWRIVSTEKVQGPIEAYLESVDIRTGRTLSCPHA